MLVLRKEWRQNGSGALAGTPTDTAFRRCERLEDRRMRLLYRLGYHADSFDDTVLDTKAPFVAGFDIPRRVAGWNAPITPIVGEDILGPGLLDNAVALFECGAVGGVDVVVLVRLGAVNTVSLLRHDIDPAALVAARKAGIGAAAGHMIEHRDIFGDSNWIAGRQHHSELSNSQPFGLHADKQVE